MNLTNAPSAALKILLHLNLQLSQRLILNKQAFTGLSNLEFLDLSFCGLTSLVSDTFDEIGNLG